LIEAKYYPATIYHPGIWIDIGRAEDYTEANRIYQAMQEAQVLC
jgi:NDP-sugar pyrophosphorylase family protein